MIHGPINIRHAYFLWQSIVEPGRPQMTIWCKNFACCLPKATDTHSEYVINILFPQKQWLCQRASALHTYILSFLCNPVPDLPYTVHVTRPRWWLVVPTAVHSRLAIFVTLFRMLLDHAGDLLCPQLCTVDSIFVTIFRMLLDHAGDLLCPQLCTVDTRYSSYFSGCY